MKCCNKTLKLQTGKQDGKELVYYVCDDCGRKGKGIDQKEAEKFFKDSKSANQEKVEPESNVAVNTTATFELIPKTDNAIDIWFETYLQIMIYNSPPTQNKEATERMLRKNIKYVKKIISDTKFKKVTSTVEGMESITDAFGDALEMSAMLGEMGDIVPFGSTAEFIPSIECYKFGLETGKNAPFKDIDILLVHENDQVIDNEISNGNYIFKYKPVIPRGEVIAVVVLATRTDSDKTIGEVYDVARLLEKAKVHSPSYKNYIIDKEDFKRMEVEGKLKTDNSGRKFMEKKFPTWTKKIYEHDIVNPYDGADRPEMLRKSAGKSFFRPYMKIRNSMAMSDEWSGETEEDSTFEQSADTVLNQARGQFQSPGIKDAVIIPDNEKSGGEKEPIQKKEELKKNQGGLFNED